MCVFCDFFLFVLVFYLVTVLYFYWIVCLSIYFALCIYFILDILKLLFRHFCLDFYCVLARRLVLLVSCVSWRVSLRTYAVISEENKP